VLGGASDLDRRQFYGGLISRFELVPGEARDVAWVRG
jgi:hypothetical protein